MSELLNRNTDPLFEKMEKIFAERDAEYKKMEERNRMREEAVKEGNIPPAFFVQIRREKKEKENDTWRKNQKVQGITGTNPKRIRTKSWILFRNRGFPYKKI